MKKIIILILAVLAFSWTPVVSAEQSPESVVTCGTFIRDYLVSSTAISGSVNADECAYSSLDHLTVKTGSEQEQPWIGLSYMLSCKNP
jgi:hypothetical protein